MEHRTLSGTDLTTSRLVLGTMTFGSQTDVAEATRMVDACLEAGITMVDTANAYNDGRSEEMLGALLKDRRDDILIATKVRNRMGPDPDDAGLSRAAINKAIDASLRRLRTDRVDLYYLHRPDHRIPIKESLGAIEDLVKAGKIRYGATSNYAAWQMTEMQWIAERNGWQPLRVSQPMYNLTSRRLDEEYAAFSAHFGISNIVYNPLAGGLLTGKHRPDSSPASDTRFALIDQYVTRYWNEAQFAAVARLQALAEESGLTLIELAFRWLLSRPLVDAVIVGASNLDQLRTNLDACRMPTLDSAVAEQCDEVWQTLRGAPPSYNR